MDFHLKFAIKVTKEQLEAAQKITGASEISSNSVIAVAQIIAINQHTSVVYSRA